MDVPWRFIFTRYLLCIFLEISEVLTQQKLQQLVGEIDPKQVLDEDVEEVRCHNLSTTYIKKKKKKKKSKLI